jgi:hypothetical protein
MNHKSRNQHGNDRRSDQKEDTNESRRNNRQNVSTRDMGVDESFEMENESDRLNTAVPDNYERDSE